METCDNCGRSIGALEDGPLTPATSGIAAAERATAPGASSTDVDARLTRLERAVRLYKWGFGISGALLLGAVSLGAAEDRGVPEVIRAKKFVVVDDRGREMALLESDRDGGVLDINNTAGNNRVHVMVTTSGEGVVRTMGNVEHAYTAMGADDEGGYLLAKGRRGNVLLNISDEEGGLVVTDKNGHITWSSRLGRRDR